MDRMPVHNSKVLKTLGYDADTQTLEVEFNDGEVGVFRCVPIRVYQGLAEKEDMDSFFVNSVVDMCPYQTVSVR
jgi:hypothetical protein